MINSKKRKLILCLSDLIIAISFLFQSAACVGGVSISSECLSPSSNLPVLYSDAAVDLIVLDVIKTLAEKGDNSAKVFYRKYVEEQINRKGKNVKCFGIRDIEKRNGGWAFYIVDLENLEITRFVSGSDVKDRFFALLNGIERINIEETAEYALDERLYKKEIFKVPYESLKFVETCLSRIYTYPDLETEILSMYPDEIGWVREHAIRTAKIAEIIASRMQLGDVLIRLIRLAALAHDLGKGCSREMIEAINSTVNGKAGIINIHMEESLKMLTNTGIKIDSVVEAGIRFHHSPWDADGGIERLVAEILHVADQIDASQDTHRPYKSLMRDIRKVLMELRGEYKGGKRISKPVYKAAYLAVSVGQKDLISVIYQARGGVKWDGQGEGRAGRIKRRKQEGHPLEKLKTRNDEKLFEIVFDAEGKIVQTGVFKKTEKTALYGEQILQDALQALAKKYSVGILSGLKQIDIVDGDGPVGSQIDAKAQIDIDVFQDKNMVLEVLEHEAIHEILSLILPNNSFLCEVVATWYSFKRFSCLLESEQENIIRILKDKSNGLDPEGKYREALTHINANKLSEDKLIGLAITYLQYKGLSVGEVKTVQQSFEEFLGLLNDLSHAYINDLKSKVYEVEKSLIKVIRTLGGIRFEGRVPENIRKVVGHMAGNEGWKIPKPYEKERMCYVVVDRERMGDRLQDSDFEAVVNELKKNNVQIVYNIDDIPHNKKVKLNRDVVVLVDPEDVKDWEGKKYKYLPLPYMPLSLKLAGHTALTGGDTRQGTPVYNFVKSFYEKLLGRKISDESATKLFSQPWQILPKSKQFTDDLILLREAISQLSASA
jgi:putative nucleotidyltransferase with HDIG domain